MTKPNTVSTIKFILAVILLIGAAQFAYAQEDDTNVPSLAVPKVDEKVPLEADKVDPKRQQRVVIFRGIEEQVKLPYLPKDAKFKGDFKKVVKVSIDRARNILLFSGVKEGPATLTVHDATDKKIYEFSITVQTSNLTKVAREMQALLAEVEGITIKIVNNRVVVDGQVLSTKHLNRVISVVDQFGPDLARSLVTLSPLAQRKIAQAIANAINNPEINVSVINDKFVLEGAVRSDDEKARAFQIAQMHVPDIVKESGEKEGSIIKVKKEFVLNLITVLPAPPKDPGKIIQMVVNFVELDRNYQKSFRFQFMPTLEDKSTVSFTQDSREPGGIVSSITGVVSNLLPKLNWAKTHGVAKVLQTTTLMVLDGQQGTIHNQVKVPFATVNGQGQSSTNFEKVGIESKITPKILNQRSDSIQLTMDFQMSSLLGITDAGPMISESAMTTIVIVRNTQSAAVGGLVSNTSGTDYNKLPKGMGDNPIISLYASKSFQRNQSQFVVFVTPVIKANAAQGSEVIKRKFQMKD